MNRCEAQGQPASLESIYREHSRFAARIIVRLCGDGTHVQDLLQEVFWAAWQGHAGYDPGRAAFRTWLYGIISNKCKQRLRSRRRRREFLERLDRLQTSGSSPAPDLALQKKQDAALVHWLLQGLPMKQREVFVLHELEGKDAPEVATLLGISQGTFWSRLHHARKVFNKLAARHLKREELGS